AARVQPRCRRPAASSRRDASDFRCARFRSFFAILRTRSRAWAGSRAAIELRDMAAAESRDLRSRRPGSTGRIDSRSRRTTRRKRDRTLRLLSPAPRGIPCMPAEGRFEIVEGAQKGAVVALAASPVTFGRAPGNGFVVKDATVSRQHAKVFERDERHFIADL